MEVVFDSKRVEGQCRNLSAAKKLVGGNESIAVALLAKVNLLEQAVNFKDVVVQPQLHFHALSDKGRHKLAGYFAIDVKGRRCPWRLIIRPLDENHDPFTPCHIDEIAETVEVVNILEASKHYE